MTEKNAIYQEKEETLSFVQIGMEILRVARNELYLNMRFLDVALSSLRFVPDGQIRRLGTDGNNLYFQPDGVVALFRKGRPVINRAYLHSIVHCLFCHLWNRKNRDVEYWNLACDIAAESIIDDLYLKAVHVPKRQVRREYYRKLKERGGVVTAERVYRFLCEEHPSVMQMELLKREFTVDDHREWENDQNQKKNSPQPQRQRWDDIRDRMQTEMETFSKEAADDVRTLEESIAAENRQRYDYREFLRKFSVLKEEMKVDMDSFDYIFYNYGMELYGNMPLIEPLETKEEQRVEDFVIVIDTSMSCKGELVRAFLDQTYAVLSESESFFRKLHIHIIQCDDQIQTDQKITCEEELKSYMEKLELKGEGGTDFRPAFTYVDEMIRQHAFEHLRGMIYFTDGRGIYPAKRPVYETAFVFMEEEYEDVDVPPWAIKIILEEGQDL